MESTNSASVMETKIIRSKRDAPPAHYILKIHSFSQLSKIVEKTGSDGKYESDEFEVGDYKWKLVLYPNGNEKTNGKGHISLYLATTDKKAIYETSGGHINVLVSFFIYDHIQDKYLTIEDGKIKRYYILRTEHGFDQLLPLSDFNDPSNGYVVDGCCVFGAEVHVIKNTVKLKADELSFIKNPPNGTFTWKIDKFSTMLNKQHFGELFSAGGCKWQLELYPKGKSDEKDCSLSFYLYLDANPCQSKVYVEYNLLAKDQINEIHHERKVSHWFKNPEGCGYRSFMLLNVLHDSSKGFLVNDTLIIEAEITLIAISKDLIS